MKTKRTYLIPTVRTVVISTSLMAASPGGDATEGKTPEGGDTPVPGAGGDAGEGVSPEAKKNMFSVWDEEFLTPNS